MPKSFKLIWTDAGQTKTAVGMGYDMHTASNPYIIIFHGYDGDIVLTANSFGGNWAIK